MPRYEIWWAAVAKNGARAFLWYNEGFKWVWVVYSARRNGKHAASYCSSRRRASKEARAAFANVAGGQLPLPRFRKIKVRQDNLLSLSPKEPNNGRQ